jgi:hypothetical protein
MHYYYFVRHVLLKQQLQQQRRLHKQLLVSSLSSSSLLLSLFPPIIMTRKSVFVMIPKHFSYQLAGCRSFSSSKKKKKNSQNSTIPKDKERLLQLVDDWELRSTDGDDYTKLKMNKRLRRLGKKIVKNWRLRDYEEGHRTILSRQFSDWQIWLSFQCADPLPDSVDDTEDMLRHCQQDFEDMLYLVNTDDFPHALDLPMEKARPCDCLVSLTPSSMTNPLPSPLRPTTMPNTTISDFDTDDDNDKNDDNDHNDKATTSTPTTESSPPPTTMPNTSTSIFDTDDDDVDDDKAKTSTPTTESLVLRCNYRFDKFYIHKAAILSDSPDVIHRHPAAHVVHPREFVPMPREGDLWRELNRFMEGTIRINTLMSDFMAEYGDYKTQREMPAFFKSIREILSG